MVHVNQVAEGELFNDHFLKKLKAKLVFLARSAAKERVFILKEGILVRHVRHRLALDHLLELLKRFQLAQ